jgi:hypothetical protein
LKGTLAPIQPRMMKSLPPKVELWEKKLTQKSKIFGIFYLIMKGIHNY